MRQYLKLFLLLTAMTEIANAQSIQQAGAVTAGHPVDTVNRLLLGDDYANLLYIAAGHPGNGGWRIRL